jgi:glutamate N-acetyltransferase/amino-acid N-acetyltransferase
MTLGPGLARTVLPKGFLTSGINSGVRKYRPDLGLILSECDAVAAGVFTKNQCKAAPIIYSQALLPSQKIRAIVTNSGQANASTGELGILNNSKMVDAIAHAISCDPSQVLVASTGVIGQHLAIEKIIEAAPELTKRCVDNAEAFALAILTTDLVPKTVSTEVQLLSGRVRITGISKGSGMIHPNMATMLGYLLTDAVLTEDQATSMLKISVDQSFNMISVDGDTSTNDCVFLMANGASGVPVSDASDQARLQKAFLEVSQVLAKAIARDGEGATKLLEVQIKGSDDLALAKKAARGITLSPLIKTAMHGEDPNWGRILARLGAEGVLASALDLMVLKLQDVVVYQKGAPVDFDRAALKQKLKTDTIIIEVNLYSGKHNATAWGCDLSKKYVEINTEYS